MKISKYLKNRLDESAGSKSRPISEDKYFRIFLEAFEARRFAEGQVAFSKSAPTDPHVKKALSWISKHTGVSVADIMMEVQQGVNKLKSIKDKAPILYHTIVDNALENELFHMFEDVPERVEGAPKYDPRVFEKLRQFIMYADHSQFFPMRGFIRRKALKMPNIVMTNDPDYPNMGKEWKSVSTAAATPTGTFIFNVKFMQKLIDWAHLKEVKPKGLKYKCNGGPIPDEYCYIEFVVLHEFLHYTEEDFYYQHIIPKANAKIINWVGDFRSNYLLVKSGYEQLPMGLFNDLINYDRQKTYIEMYELVKSEFDKLNDQEKNDVSDKMDNNSDDHEPGQDSDPGDIDPNTTPEDIDKNHDKVEEKIKQGKDGGDKPTKPDPKPGDDQPNRNANMGGRGSKKDPRDSGIDYSKIEPTFSWIEIIRQFVGSSQIEIEETRTKPARRGISGIHTAVQLGAGSLPPSEMQTDITKVKLCFVVDNSGSMGGVIEKTYSEIVNLFKINPKLRNVEFFLIKFSGDFYIYRASISKDSYMHVPNMNDQNGTWEKGLNVLWNKTIGGATNFSSEMTAELASLVSKKYNILIFSDSDIVSGANLEEVKKLFKLAKNGSKVFTVFDSRESWLQFRQNSGFSTSNITYFK